MEDRTKRRRVKLSESFKGRGQEINKKNRGEDSKKGREERNKREEVRKRRKKMGIGLQTKK